MHHSSVAYQNKIKDKFKSVVYLIHFVRTCKGLKFKNFLQMKDNGHVEMARDAERQTKGNVDSHLPLDEMFNVVFSYSFLISYIKLNFVQ